MSKFHFIGQMLLAEMSNYARVYGFYVIRSIDSQGASETGTSISLEGGWVGWGGGEAVGLKGSDL